MAKVKIVVIFQGSFVTYTFQAMTDLERKLWVEALGGSLGNTLGRLKSDPIGENVDSPSLAFLQTCLNELEARGLKDHGLYRVGGVLSKVQKLLQAGRDPKRNEKLLNLGDCKVWESKTIASAIKQYLRDLSKPLLTYHLYGAFLEAAKYDSEEKRLEQLKKVVEQIPNVEKELLCVLIRHLNKVAANADVNMMSASNLGVCFGPTLLRPQEQTVASIMDIKFCNEVIEMLIEHCHSIFPSEDDEKTTHVEDALEPSDEIDIGKRSVERGSSAPANGSSTPASFSQLSTNSLPNIKEFKVVLDHSDDNSNCSVVSSNSSSSMSKKPQSYGGSRIQESSEGLWGSSTQDELQASLQMMNNLAADLPAESVTSALKRSLTFHPLNPKQIGRRPSSSRAETGAPTPPPRGTWQSYSHLSLSNNRPKKYESKRSDPSLVKASKSYLSSLYVDMLETPAPNVTSRCSEASLVSDMVKNPTKSYVSTPFASRGSVETEGTGNRFKDAMEHSPQKEEEDKLGRTKSLQTFAASDHQVDLGYCPNLRSSASPVTSVHSIDSNCSSSSSKYENVMATHRNLQQRLHDINKIESCQSGEEGDGEVSEVSSNSSVNSALTSSDNHVKKTQ